MPDPKTSAVSENRSATLGLVMALVLIVVAYYPTLVENFAPQDQWRAFRYSLEPGLPGDRYDACFNTTIKFYFLTGRWLVWIGECIEHSAVAQIKDFTPLRVIVLGVVLLSAIIFRKVLTGVINCPRLAIVPAVMATLLPGYAFMYYQGLTGLPVLLAFPLALLSFHFISPALTEKIEGNTTYGLVMGGIFFLSACFIYPVFAFTVIPTAFIFSAFRPEISLGKRISLCARFCAYYLVVSIIYFLMVKSGITVAEHLGKSIPDLKNYRFDILTDSGELINKLGIVFHELTHMPLASFLNVPAWLCLTILLGPAGIMFYEGERLNWGRTLSILAVVLYALSIPAIAVASVFPWFLSHTLGDVYRHMLPIHFLLILSFGILVTRGIEKLKLIYGELSARRIESTILV
ncbi:MAG: hypothetical protein OEM27_03100, partial [Nitrospinota bacterium]|nr:hypothetical protein [Nitrospinota bacterium]